MIQELIIAGGQFSKSKLLVRTVCTLSYHHWLKQSWRSKMAIVWLKGAFLIITTVLHKKRLNIYQA